MTTTAKARCETVDQIIVWEQVKQGDLVLHEGRLELVADIHIDELGDGLLGVLFDGCSAHRWLARDAKTAVARYVETTEE